MGKRERNTALFTIVGMAFWWPMLRNSIVGFVFSSSNIGESQSQSDLMIFIAASAALALVLVFMPRLAKYTIHRGALLTSCLGASLLTLIVFCDQNAHPILLVFDALILAYAYVALPLAWGSVLIDQMGDAPKRLLLVLAASYATSFVIGYLSYLPSPFDLIRPIGAPALSALAWFSACRSGKTNHRSSSIGSPSFGSRAGEQNLYVLVLVLFLASSVATGFINLGTVTYRPSFSTFVRDTLNVGVTASLLAVIALSRHLERIKFVLIVMLAILLFGGIFIATVFQCSWFDAGIGLMQTAKSCFSLLLYMLVVMSASERPSHARLRTLPLLFVLPTTASSFISYLVVPYFTSLFDVPYSEFWGLLSLLMGFLLGVFLFGFLSAIVIRYLPHTTTAETNESGKNVIVASMKESYSLTEKEAEVLALLLEGNTYKKIATLLYVSDSTVQSHAKSIYRKAGVHSKQELVDRATRMREHLL